MSTRSYVKYYLRTTPIHFHPCKDSRLAHLYGLPKTHKVNLSIRPILSATRTYNYNLAKWLEEKLKPLSVNDFTIANAIRFSDKIRNSPISEDDILVSYDVTALFTNVPLNEIINILVEKAFTLIFKRMNSQNFSRSPLLNSFFSYGLIPWPMSSFAILKTSLPVIV